eukprot:TRINITY_DN2156_c0_g1_i2.p1 TRINITY_DN2156_c0_g1~~TRINITY_DN2156_c0_g1_i2.p1  ORF type:complete len:440 (-),score=119.74 TRINITY_DN2156_c0_g1_i2:302-1621(-)
MYYWSCDLIFSLFLFRGRGRKSHPQERAVSWIRVPTAPSIPVKLQSHGYEEGKFGELVMQGPDEEGHDGIAETVGPGHYDPSDKFLAGKKTRVANFSKYAGRTDETKKVANIPGPGYYDTTKEITSPNKNKPSAAFRSTVNRSTGAAPKKKRTNSTPGPGQYTVQESFKKQNVPEERQFFGSSSRRFADNSLPVTINAPIYYGETVPATSSIAGMRPPGKQVAFHGSAPRFREGTQKPRGTTAPGVGQYDLPQSFEVERKEGKSGPFGSSVRRFWKPSNKVGIPGPGTYSKDPVPSQKTKTLIDKASAVFQSSGSRFVDGGGNLKEKRPSPGEYDITRSWDQAGKNGLMSSGNPRFFDKKDKAHLGPGTYKVESSFELEKKRKMVNRKNILVSKAGRFSFNGTGENPGPGQYDSQNPYDQMTKPTFNMTIAQGTLVSPL